MQNNLKTSSALLVCHASSEIGIGHLSRLLTLAQGLKKDNKIISELLIIGDVIEKDELSNFNVHTCPITDDLTIKIKNMVQMYALMW